MSYLCQQILQTVEALSVQEKQQVLDFVEFLWIKHQQPRKKAQGRKMADILEKIAVSQDITDINPVMWQQEIRQDRLLPER